MSPTPCILLVLMVVCLASCEEGTTQSPTLERKTKLGELLFAGFSPLTTLIIVKFKLVLIALLVLAGTAATTKFVAGLFHFLGHEKRRRPYYKPVGIKYEKPSYDHLYFDKPYHEEPYFHYYTKNRVERAVRHIERSN